MLVSEVPQRCLLAVRCAVVMALLLFFKMAGLMTIELLVVNKLAAKLQVQAVASLSSEGPIEHSVVPIQE
jgi:hypothetical protein